MTITIKRYDGSVIVSGDYPDIRAAVEDCTKKNISLEKAYLSGADLLGAILSRANLEGAYLPRANLADANLSGANLEGAYLFHANFQDANLQGTNLYGATLTAADLICANLQGTYLPRADLRGARLYRANLSGAALSFANLYDANLAIANLSGANLYGASLTDANLSGANLEGAELYGAELDRADLSGATLPDFQLCPQGKSFVAYKKLKGGLIATLEIPADVPRTSSLIGRKCRAQSARILSIEAPDGTLVSEGVSLHDITFIYRTGEVVSGQNYDPDIRVECARGVHFFMTKEEARQYRY